MNAGLALVFVVCAPVLGSSLFSSCARSPAVPRPAEAVDQLNDVVQESLTAIRAVKAFVRGDYEEEKFRDGQQRADGDQQRTFRCAVLNLPAFQLAMYGRRAHLVVRAAP